MEAWAYDREIHGPPSPTLQLYVLCKATKWAHLPVAGGWYDQHPTLVQRFLTIMQIEARAEKEKQDRERRKNQSAGASQGKRPMSRRGRR